MCVDGCVCVCYVYISYERVRVKSLAKKYQYLMWIYLSGFICPPIIKLLVPKKVYKKLKYQNP